MVKTSGLLLHAFRIRAHYEIKGFLTLFQRSKYVVCT